MDVCRDTGLSLNYIRLHSLRGPFPSSDKLRKAMAIDPLIIFLFSPLPVLRMIMTIKIKKDASLGKGEKNSFSQKNFRWNPRRETGPS